MISPNQKKGQWTGVVVAMHASSTAAPNSCTPEVLFVRAIFFPNQFYIILGDYFLSDNCF